MDLVHPFKYTSACVCRSAARPHLLYQVLNEISLHAQYRRVMDVDVL